MASNEDPQPPDAQLSLHGVRVLECGDTLALAYAGRLLADLGAHVVKVEQPHGDPLRRLLSAPTTSGSPGDCSAAYAYFHGGKQSVVVDVEAAPGLLSQLASRADVVLRGTLDGSDWLDDAALAAHPSLITADISTFGRAGGPDGQGGAGPYSDLLALAAGGLLSTNSTRPGDPNSTPLRYRGEIASVHAGGGAVLAVLGALMARRHDGIGERIDISAQAAVTAVCATAVPSWTYGGVVPVHDGVRGVGPWSFYPCIDGQVIIQITEDPQFTQLVQLFGNPEWGSWEVFATTKERAELADVLDPLICEETQRFTVDGLLDACNTYGVAAAAINDATRIMQWDHLRQRAYLQPLELPTGCAHEPIVAPTPPWRLRNDPPYRRGKAEPLGPAADDVTGIWPASELRSPDATAARPGAPLAGVRVIDLTWVWAGPYAAMQLAHLGADVIKVESSQRVDVTRRLGPFPDEQPGVNRSGYFNQYNQGKRGIVLDPTSPKGKEVLRGLLASADVVIDNMRAGALARMGFPYEELLAVNPRIVAVSMTGFGETGPESGRMAYGSIIDALSGIATANGPPGGGPTDFAMSLPDPCAGIHAAIATVAALWRTQRTGRGDRVECSMLEASLAAFPWPVLHQSATGSPMPVIGNRDDLIAPHGIYRCQGGYQWVAVAVSDDAQFAALCRTMGDGTMSTDQRFATNAARLAHQDELDARISAWSAPLDAHHAAAVLQAAGVPAERVAHFDEVAASPRLASRDFFTRLDHPEVGDRPLAGVPWTTERSPMRTTRPAPCLGQHTHEVLAEVLGLSTEAIAALEADGVLR